MNPQRLVDISHERHFAMNAPILELQISSWPAV